MEGENQVGPTEQAQASNMVMHGESDAAMTNLKKMRAQLRGKITRSINRIKKFIDQGGDARKRVEKEILQLDKDFELAHECHTEFYEYVDESHTQTMDEWEDILTNDIYDIEEMVEDFIQPLATPQHANPMSLNNEQTYEQSY